MRRFRLGFLFCTWMVVCAQAQMTGTQGFDRIRRLNFLRTESVAAGGVDTGTGAFTLESTVFSLDGGRTIPITLRYNSLLGQGAEHFSPGWAHDYEAYISGNPAGVVNVNLDSTRQVRFQASGGNYTPIDEAGRYDRLTRASNAFTYTRRDGTIYEFDTTNKLKRLGNKVRQFLELRYNDRDELIEIKEPIANRILTVQPARDRSGRIQYVLDQENRIVYFGYDGAGRLTSIHPAATLPAPPTTNFITTAIPDGTQNGVTRNTVVNSTAPIGLVNFATGSISHARPSDLRVSVRSPIGTTADLTFSNAEGPNIDLKTIVLDAFVGENPQGTWQITFRDVVAGTSGSFEVTTLRFTVRTDPTRFQYGAGGRLVSGFDADGERMFTLTYDSEGRVFEQDDAIDTNLRARFQYIENAQGLTTIYTDRLGHATEYRHDSGHHLTQVVDPLNRTTRFAYDANGNRTTLTDALGRVTRYAFDANGDITQVTDPAGGVTTMSYDANHNLLSVRDANGNTSTFEYDSNNNLRAVTDAEGNRDTKTYGANSKMTGNLMADGGGITYTYSNGMTTGAAHPATGANMGAGYDKSGRVTTLKDADGFETKITYDSQGREVRKENALGFFETTTFDRRGRMVASRDFNGNSTTLAYDRNDNLVSVRDPLGRTIRYEYDGEDRMVKTIAHSGASSQLAYDRAGQVIEETDPFGDTVRYQYDAAGNLTARFDAKGDLIERITYNALDLPIRREDGDGNVVATQYDGTGRPTRATNPLDRTVEFTFDKIDRPVAFKDPLNRTARREFARDDMVSRLIDAKGGAVRFTYDPANRLTGVELQFGFLRFTYNNRDLVTQFRTPTGSNFNYSYDGAGRVTQIAPSGTNASLAATLRYSYDGNGNALTVQESGGAGGTRTTTREYDALNRVTRYTDGRGNTLRYRYDAAGNLADLTYPDGKLVFYTYDNASRLTEVRDWDGRRLRYQYDANGRITRIDMPNGTRRVMAYDAQGRVLRRQDRASSGQIILDYRYSYDADGKLGVSSNSSAVPTGNIDGATFSYDNGNRMTSYNGQAVTVSQDGRVTRGPLASGLADFTYDFRGNLDRAGGTRYFFDSEDRLTAWQNGSRTETVISNPVGDFSQVLVKLDTAGPTVRYVWGVGLAYEVSEATGLRVYHFDERGSVAAVSDSQGTVVGRISYSPYGAVIARSGAGASGLFEFQGLFGVIHTANDLLRMGARWYSPVMSRFLTEDPYFGTIERMGSLNRYAYAGADPINRNDPSGKFWQLIGAAVGAVVGIAAQGVSDLIQGKFSGWKAYAGAAIGGAVSGLVLSTTGCVACAGAAGAAAEYASTQLLKGERIDPVQLLVSAGVGAVLGKVGDKAGKVLGAAGKSASKAVSKALGRQAARPLAQRFSRKFIQQALRREATKVKIEKLIGELPEEFATGLAENLVNNYLFADASTTGGVDGGPIGDDIEEGAALLNKNRVQNYGEFIHWKIYLESLRIAAVPVPNNPNNLLASF